MATSPALGRKAFLPWEPPAWQSTSGLPSPGEAPSPWLSLYCSSRPDRSGLTLVRPDIHNNACRLSTRVIMCSSFMSAPRVLGRGAPLLAPLSD